MMILILLVALFCSSHAEEVCEVVERISDSAVHDSSSVEAGATVNNLEDVVLQNVSTMADGLIACKQRCCLTTDCDVFSVGQLEDGTVGCELMQCSPSSHCRYASKEGIVSEVVLKSVLTTPLPTQATEQATTEETLEGEPNTTNDTQAEQEPTTAPPTEEEPGATTTAAVTQPAKDDAPGDDATNATTLLMATMIAAPTGESVTTVALATAGPAANESSEAVEDIFDENNTTDTTNATQLAALDDIFDETNSNVTTNVTDSPGESTSTAGPTTVHFETPAPNTTVAATVYLETLVPNTTVAEATATSTTSLYTTDGTTVPPVDSILNVTDMSVNSTQSSPTPESVGTVAVSSIGVTAVEYTATTTLQLEATEPAQANSSVSLEEDAGEEEDESGTTLPTETTPSPETTISPVTTPLPEVTHVTGNSTTGNYSAIVHADATDTESKFDTVAIPTIIAIFAFSLVLIIVVSVLVGKRCFEGWRRRHYQKVDDFVEGLHR